MSLSFVKSAVLSSTDGVSHDTEQSIDNPETTSLRKSSSHKPLFEQLRANKEAEDEKYAELQRQMMGTRALDEEDVAHLDAVERVREEKEMEVKSGIEREVALFRAARVDRGLARTTVGEDEEEEGGDAAEGLNVEDEKSGGTMAKDVLGQDHATKKEANTIVPKFTIKKKRKRAPPPEESKSSDTSENQSKKKAQEDGSKTQDKFEIKGEASSSDKQNEKPSKGSDTDSSDQEGGLLGLGCYGSDSD